jgi:hypothetical protein
MQVCRDEAGTQAKGRIERLWQTLQDRLVSELRLQGTTPEAANAVLPVFRADYNRRFTRPPARPRPAWRPPPRELPVLPGCRYHRRVAADNTVRFGLRGLQLPPGPRRRSWQGGLREACVLHHRQDRDGQVCEGHGQFAQGAQRLGGMTGVRRTVPER